MVNPLPVLYMEAGLARVNPTPDVIKTIVNEVKNFSKMAESSLISV
jgi:hypothetical protein